MSHSGRMLFTSTATGAIRAVKYPLTEAGEWQDYQAHASSITKVRGHFIAFCKDVGSQIIEIVVLRLINQQVLIILQRFIELLYYSVL